MILNHLLKKFQIIRICKLQRQQLNLLVKKIGVIVGYVNQWKAKLKVYVVWTQMKFLMIILKVIISFISFIISFTTEAATWTCGKVSFLIKLQTRDLQLYYKRDSGTGVFLWVLQRFKEHLFSRTPPDDCLCYYNIKYTTIKYTIKNSLFSGNKCVNVSEGFKTACLTKNVLKTALSALNHLRGDNLTDTSSSQRTFQRCFNVVFWLMRRRDVGQRQVYVETTLCISTLEFTTSNNVESMLCISTLIWTTLDNIETTLSFSTLIWTTLVNVETTLWKWPFLKRTRQIISKRIHGIRSFN